MTNPDQYELSPDGKISPAEETPEQQLAKVREEMRANLEEQESLMDEEKELYEKKYAGTLSQDDEERLAYIGNQVYAVLRHGFDDLEKQEAELEQEIKNRG